MSNTNYDVVIVGCGPAGIFTAYRLVKNNYHGSILLIDSGKSIINRKCPMREKPGTTCTNCKPCNIMSGFGGAGTFSDCKLSLCPVDVGGDITNYIGIDIAKKYAKEVDDIFSYFDPRSEERKIIGDDNSINELNKEFHNLYTSFVDVIYNPTKHLGTDGTYIVMTNMFRFLKGFNNIEFMFNTTVTDISNINEHFNLSLEQSNVLNNTTAVTANTVVLAPGRVGNTWVVDIVKSLGIKTFSKHVDIGMRVETNADFTDKVTNLLYDMKFKYTDSSNGNIVRTFCTNPHGFVSEEHYNNNAVVNGHSFTDIKSNMTNFAILVTLNNDSINSEYAKLFMQMVNKVSNNKPIVQNFIDFKTNFYSHHTVHDDMRTLKSARYFNFNDIYPRAITDLVKRFIELLDLSYIPGLNSNQTWLYGPEIKFYSNNIECNNSFETPVKNLYVAGDGVGVTRGIIQAATNGLVVADSILTKLQTGE